MKPPERGLAAALLLAVLIVSVMVATHNDHPRATAVRAVATSPSSTSTSTTTTTTVPPAPSTTTRPAIPTTSRSRPAARPAASAPSSVTPVAGPTAGATARATWYQSGSGTANGERFNPDGLTFAHRTMAFGTRVRFCNGGRCVVARCNDRGPFVGGVSFDLSRGTFASIAPLSAGVITVTWEVV
jgi:rare lipoprotein A